jgi:hypothetical protein
VKVEVLPLPRAGLRFIDYAVQQFISYKSH